MPHTILIFDGDNEDDREELKIHQQANAMHFALWDMGQIFREHLKYNNENLSDKELEIVEKLNDKFYEILDDRHVRID